MCGLHKCSDSMIQIDSNLTALHGAAGRLNNVARAVGKEVDEQNRHLERINAKVDSSCSGIPNWLLLTCYDRVQRSMIRSRLTEHVWIDSIEAVER